MPFEQEKAVSVPASSRTNINRLGIFVPSNPESCLKHRNILCLNRRSIFLITEYFIFTFNIYNVCVHVSQFRSICM